MPLRNFMETMLAPLGLNVGSCWYACGWNAYKFACLAFSTPTHWTPQT